MCWQSCRRSVQTYSAQLIDWVWFGCFRYAQRRVTTNALLAFAALRNGTVRSAAKLFRTSLLRFSIFVAQRGHRFVCKRSHCLFSRVHSRPCASTGKPTAERYTSCSGRSTVYSEYCGSHSLTVGHCRVRRYGSRALRSRCALAVDWPPHSQQREHMPKRSVLMRSADAQVHMGTIVIRGLLLELLARNPTVSVAMLETIFVLAQLAAHFLFGRRSTLHV